MFFSFVISTFDFCFSSANSIFKVSKSFGLSYISQYFPKSSITDTWSTCYNVLTGKSIINEILDRSCLVRHARVLFRTSSFQTVNFLRSVWNTFLRKLMVHMCQPTVFYITKSIIKLKTKQLLLRQVFELFSGQN